MNPICITLLLLIIHAVLLIEVMCISYPLLLAIRPCAAFQVPLEQLKFDDL
jgi:hypothetical protein